MQTKSLPSWLSGITERLAQAWEDFKLFLGQSRATSFSVQYRVLSTSARVNLPLGNDGEVPRLQFSFPIWVRNFGKKNPVPRRIELRLRGREWEQLVVALAQHGVRTGSPAVLQPSVGQRSSAIIGCPIKAGRAVQEALVYDLPLEFPDKFTPDKEWLDKLAALARDALAPRNGMEILCYFGAKEHFVRATPNQG